MDYSAFLLQTFKYGFLLAATALLGILISLYLSTPLVFTPNAALARHYATVTESSSPATLPVPGSKQETTLTTDPTDPLPSGDTSVYAAAVSSTLSDPRFPTEGLFAPINDVARNAMVNIFCTRKSEDATRTSSGSGIIIDPRGVVLTNAHVAELFLLEGRTTAGTVRCTLRSGNPARDTYEAELLYMPERWIREFAPRLYALNARGTGESDFALLLITDVSGQQKELPEAFPYLPFTTERHSTQKEEQVLIAGYPAIIETLNGIRKNLYLVSTLATVEELFTFDDDTLDLFSVGGTIASREGSSGGAVVNDRGELTGVIVTSTHATSTLSRKLRAITLEHIDRALAAETGATLATYLDGNLSDMQEAFETNLAPLLASYVLQQFEE